MMRSRRFLASLLSAALLAAAPGPNAWAAAARIVPIKVNAPVGGQVGAHHQNLKLSQPQLTLTGPSLGAPSLSAPAQAKIVPGVLVDPLQAAAAVSAQAESVEPLPAVQAAEAAALSEEPVQAAVTQGSYAKPASTIAVGLTKLKRLFGGKTKVELSDSPVGKESAGKSQLSKSEPKTQNDGGDDNVPPTPPSNDDGGNGGGKGWFGLPKTAVMFIAALLVAQVGVEALGVAMPTLMQKTFGDFTAVAQLAIFSSVASIIGRQVGSLITEKYGLRKTYLGATAIRLVSMTALVTLLATGHMTLPLMIGFYSINGLLGGVAITAEASIPPALVGKDQAKIERFWTIEQTALEVLGFLGPIAFGSIVGGMGFMPALIAFPVTFAAALAIMFMTLRIPQKVEMARLADLKKKQESGEIKGVGSIFKQFFQRIGHGAKLVWHNPVLRTAFLGYTAIMVLNPYLYQMIGPAFGLRLIGADNPEVATAVAGWLTGLYSLGGLFGGLIMMREQKKLKGLPEAESNEALRKSMLKWMKWTTVSLAAMLTLALPVPMLGSIVALPAFLSWAGTLTLPALALIPYGIAQVIAMVKLKSFFQSQVPNADKEMPAAMGFFGSASLAVSTAGLLGLKYLFKGFEGFTPFWIIGGLMVPLAIYYLYATRQLNKATAPGAAPAKPVNVAAPDQNAVAQAASIARTIGMWASSLAAVGTMFYMALAAQAAGTLTLGALATIVSVGLGIAFGGTLAVALIAYLLLKK